MAATSLKNALVLTGSLAVIVASATATSAAQVDQGTRPQHREWMRKFETPGGTLNESVMRQGRVPAEPIPCRSATSGDQPAEC